VVVPLAVAGIIGWAALPMLKIETDPARLLPAGRQEVADAQQVQREIGLAGEVDLVVTGGNVADPKVVAWMAAASKQAETGSGGQLKDLSSLSAFLEAFNNGQAPDPALTARILQNIPSYFTQAVITPDKSVGRTVFGVTALNSVEQDQALVKRLQALPAPPAGYRAFPAGLAVVASDALARLSADELKLNLLALALVLAVLVLAYRNPLPALLAVLPTAVAAGWATGLLFLLGGRSSPITVLMAGVVVAFATEFSVLWLSRYRIARKKGSSALDASEEASRRIGPAIVASAAALALGFIALAASPVPMVRDFGIWSGADIALATLAVLVLLPPLARRWL
jgi:predicted RND superfamily exporter protein